jgi:parallel beta-helix repeat protein
LIYDLCCSLNTVNILDNAGDIRGNDTNGARIESCLYESGVEDIECIGSSVTTLTVSGNRFINSEESGISVCCGAFEATGVGKSAITDNIIQGNGEDGIELDSVFGMNIGPNNTISGNGTNQFDAGIEIENETSLAIWEDTEAGGGLCAGLGVCDIIVPAHNNTITQNSIFDNVKLGIDLEGLDVPGGDYDDVSRVGCISIDKAPIDPNACIPFPTITIVAAGDKVGGTGCSLCTIELFLVDATPADQPGPLGVQHGEGMTYLVSGEADVAGNFTITLPCGLSAGDLTATNTDKQKNTSEFAANRPFLGSAACTAPTATPTNTVPAAEATATATVPPAAATPQEKPCGDVNDDGSVDAIDASLILQLVAGTISTLPNLESGDVSGDGLVSSVDASIILQLTAGIIESLNC